MWTIASGKRNQIQRKSLKDTDQLKICFALLIKAIYAGEQMFKFLCFWFFLLFFFLSIFPPIPISKLWITVGRKMSFSINSNISVVCRNGCIFLMLASMFVIKKITNQTPMTSSPLLTPASKNDLTKPWYAISDTKRETKNELVRKQQLFESTF